MPQSPQDFDAASFWENSDYARKEYVDDPLTPEKVAAVEKALGYRLPAAYIALCRTQNGGLPRRTCHRTNEPTSWAKDHVAVHGIFSIGDAKAHSLVATDVAGPLCHRDHRGPGDRPVARGRTTAGLAPAAA